MGHTYAKTDKTVTAVSFFVEEIECKERNKSFKTKLFDCCDDGGGKILSIDEALLHPATRSTTVHYLTRWGLSSAPTSEVFDKAIKCSAMIKGHEPKVESYLRDLDAGSRCLNPTTVRAAIKLSEYEAVDRGGVNQYHISLRPTPNDEVIEYIITLVNRAKAFFLSQGITQIQIPFDGKDTLNNLSGNVSFLTSDTLWEMKVINDNDPEKTKHPKTADRVALLVYLIMLKHEGRDIDNSISKIGLYNAVNGKSYVLDINKLDPNVYNEIERLIYG